MMERPSLEVAHIKWACLWATMQSSRWEAVPSSASPDPTKPSWGRKHTVLCSWSACSRSILQGVLSSGYLTPFILFRAGTRPVVPIFTAQDMYKRSLCRNKTRPSLFFNCLLNWGMSKNFLVLGIPPSGVASYKPSFPLFPPNAGEWWDLHRALLCMERLESNCTYGHWGKGRLHVQHSWIPGLLCSTV